MRPQSDSSAMRCRAPDWPARADGWVQGVSSPPSARLLDRPRNEGYHGGAALAEMSIPWLVMARRGIEVRGRAPIGDQAAPAWHRPRSFEETLRP